MEDEWKIQIRNYLQDPITLEDISAFLKTIKDAGVQQSEIDRYLESLRNDAKNEAFEDRILEILDIVIGWCNPKYKILW